MFCTKCGNELKEGERFCTKCGAKVPDVASDQASEGPSEDSKTKAPEAEAHDAPSAAPAPQKGGAGRIVLIVLVVLLAAGLIGGGILAATLIRYRADIQSVEESDGDDEDDEDDEDEGTSHRRRGRADDEEDTVTEEAVTEAPAAEEAAPADEDSDEMETVRLDDLGLHDGSKTDSYDEYDVAVEEDGTPEPDEDDFYAGMIFTDSDRRYLTESELMDLTKQELKLARNEIYARRGRMFKDAELQGYYDRCEWYERLVEPDKFNEQILNDYEMYNRDLITKVEKKKGYR